MPGRCINTFELLCLPGLSPQWVNLVSDGWMPKDVPEVKRGYHSPPWGRRLRGEKADTLGERMNLTFLL